MELKILNLKAVRKKENQWQIGPIENKQQDDRRKPNHTRVKTYQLVHFKCVWFIVCQLYLNTAVSKMKKEDVDHS